MRGNCKTFAKVDGTKPVPHKMQVPRNICAVMGGPRFVAAWFCNYPLSKNRILLSFAIPFLAFLLIGCGNQEPQTMPPEAVAEKFVTSLARKDLETACAMTIPALRETIATNLEAYSPATASDFPVRIGQVRRSKDRATVQVQLVFPSRVNTDELVLVQTNGQWLVESL